MRKKELHINIYECDSIYELSEKDKKLVLAAKEASNGAYAPYSNFRVGAAVLLENGELVVGNNQENVDFTDGLCAERVAMLYANANFPDQAVESIAISAKGEKGLTKEPAFPCGSCRQVFIETQTRYKHPIRFILDGAKKIVIVENAESLLPFAFKPDSLD